MRQRRRPWVEHDYTARPIGT